MRASLVIIIINGFFRARPVCPVIEQEVPWRRRTVLLSESIIIIIIYIHTVYCNDEVEIKLFTRVTRRVRLQFSRKTRTPCTLTAR